MYVIAKDGVAYYAKVLSCFERTHVIFVQWYADVDKSATEMKLMNSSKKSETSWFFALFNYVCLFVCFVCLFVVCFVVCFIVWLVGWLVLVVAITYFYFFWLQMAVILSLF